MGITSLMLEQQEMEHNSSTVKENAESLGLIMGSSSLLLNLINNLLDVKKATANSKYATQIQKDRHGNYASSFLTARALLVSFP